MKKLAELARRKANLRAQLAETDAAIVEEVRRIQCEEQRGMTEAARTLGVTRQALYKMLRG